MSNIGWGQCACVLGCTTLSVRGCTRDVWVYKREREREREREGVGAKWQSRYVYKTFIREERNKANKLLNKVNYCTHEYAVLCIIYSAPVSEFFYMTILLCVACLFSDDSPI